MTIGYNNSDAVTDLVENLNNLDYVADPAIATSLHLAQVLERPLLIEGRAGVGKTQIAATMSELLDTELIRLQCYEGLDVNAALYEWNYPKQLLWIRMNERGNLSPSEMETEIFGRQFLLERPLLAALTKEKAPVLLIDEVDRADEEFEAFLLEILSEFQVTIPELGTIKASNKPLVILTSNRTRDLSDALRRRCLYLWVDYPELQKELQIVRKKVEGVSEQLARQVCEFVQATRTEGLGRNPGVSETLDWTTAMVALHMDYLDPEVVTQTVGTLIKDADDLNNFKKTTIERIIQSIG
ncbi:MAG: ATPase [Chloroflexi bacterium]|nr:ATPase [Chloroflexota bacterium]